jgi:ABC-type sugar transport system substrate-binding protein
MKRTLKVVALALPLALVAVACGDDGDEGGETTEAAGGETTEAAGGETTEAAGGGDGLAAAQADIDTIATAGTAIGPTVALTGVPEKKTFAWLECEQPSCLAIRPGFEAAAEALGWELLIIPAASFDQGSAIEQALAQGADYIAHTGSPLATAEEAIANAAAAGVPYISCYATDVPDVANNNLLMQCGDSSGVFANGEHISNWVIVDSAAKANVLLVNIPDFPVLVSEADGVKAAYTANCSDCTLQELNVTVDQLIAGEVASAVTAAVQGNPDINYIQYTFGDLPAGSVEALESAGLLEGRKIVGVDFSAQLGLPGIIDGTHAAWTANPKPYAAWLMVDAAARHSLGMDNPQERANALLPTFIVDTAEEAQPILDLGPDGWPGPDGYEDAFKALWGV